MKELIARLRNLFARLTREYIVSDDPYYGWADTRLDELAEELRRARD